MDMTEKLDLRDMDPPERHPKIFEAFEKLDDGEELVIINDHDPKPLYYEMKAEVEDFDADGYRVEKKGDHRFEAKLPKKSEDVETETRRLNGLELETRAEIFDDPKTVLLELDEGEKIPSHRHPDKKIVFFVLSGTMRVEVGEETYSVEESSLLRFSGNKKVSPEGVTDSKAILFFS